MCMKSSMKTNRRTDGIFFLLMAGLILLGILSLLWGTAGFALTSDALMAKVVWHLRFPRLAAAFFAGGALALSGAVIQKVLSNRMASPSVLGINSGAGFFATLCSGLFGSALFVRQWASLAGALIAALGILLLASTARASKMTVVLAGLAVSQIFSAGIDLLLVLLPDALTGYASFKIGSFSGVSLQALLFPCLLICTAAGLIFLCRQPLEILCVSEEHARSAGLSTRFWRPFFLGLAAILAGSAVSYGGMISFVGLIVPGVLWRYAFRSGPYLGLCFLCGALLCIFCDFIGRIAFMPYELPAGMLLSLVGAPFFLYLLMARSRHGHD